MLALKLITQKFFIAAAILSQFFHYETKAQEIEPVRLTLDQIRAIQTKEKFLQKAFPSLQEPFSPEHKNAAILSQDTNLEVFLWENSPSWTTYFTNIKTLQYFNNAPHEIKNYIKNIAEEYTVPVQIIFLKNENNNLIAKAALFNGMFKLNSNSIYQNCITIYESFIRLYHIKKNDPELLHAILHECGHLQLHHSLKKDQIKRYNQELEADLWASVFAPKNKKQEARTVLRNYINEKLKRSDNYPTTEELETWLEKLEEVDPIE